jgi:hypothetical protein
MFNFVLLQLQGCILLTSKNGPLIPIMIFRISLKFCSIIFIDLSSSLPSSHSLLVPIRQCNCQFSPLLTSLFLKLHFISTLIIPSFIPPLIEPIGRRELIEHIIVLVWNLVTESLKNVWRADSSKHVNIWLRLEKKIGFGCAYRNPMQNVCHMVRLIKK